MELKETIKNRRSIRQFSEQQLENDVLEKIIDAGNNAPSHCNTQGWKFIFVKDPEIKKEMFESGGSHVIKNAPYGILTLYNTALTDNIEYKDWIQSSSAAIQNMLLTIHDLGLGGCWVCHLPKKRILSKILDIKKPYSPIAYIAFGYPKSSNQIEMPRKHKISEILAIDKFNWPAEKIPIKVYITRLAKRIYFMLPKFIKKIIFPIVDKFVKKFHN